MSVVWFQAQHIPVSFRQFILQVAAPVVPETLVEGGGTRGGLPVTFEMLSRPFDFTNTLAALPNHLAGYITALPIRL
jgi:hypothetical protein